jgi:hypothetical protein
VKSAKTGNFSGYSPYFGPFHFRLAFIGFLVKILDFFEDFA